MNDSTLDIKSNTSNSPLTGVVIVVALLTLFIIGTIVVMNNCNGGNFETFSNMVSNPIESWNLKEMAWLKNHTNWIQKGSKNKGWAGFGRVYFITLPERLNNVKQISEKLNMGADAWIFRAINKKNLNIKTLINKEMVKWYYGLPDNIGRIACHLSHLACIKHFLNDSTIETCIIFEDDLKIPEITTINQTIKFNKNLKDSGIDWNILYLGYCYENYGTGVGNGIQKLNSPLCLHAYVINKESAQIILNDSLPIYKDGDHMYKDLIKESKLRAFGPTKMWFEQNRETFGSTLNNYNSLPQYEMIESIRKQSQRKVNDVRELQHDWLRKNTNWVQRGKSKIDWAGFDNVYFVTLDSRLDNVKSVEKAMGISGKSSIFKAIDKKILNRKELIENKLVSASYYDGVDRNGKDNYGRIACHLGHTACILDFLNDPNAETAVIFEDDLKIPGPFANDSIKKLHDNLTKMKINWNIIYLGYCFENKFDIIGNGIAKLYRPWCLHAYVINKQAARMILNKSLPMRKHGDVIYADLIKSNELHAYGPETIHFWQNAEKFGTTLNNNIFSPPQYKIDNLVQYKFEEFGKKIKSAFTIK